VTSLDQLTSTLNSSLSGFAENRDVGEIHLFIRHTAREEKG
jgi:hypothetical protein